MGTAGPSQLTWHHRLCCCIGTWGCGCHPCGDRLSRQVGTTPPMSPPCPCCPPFPLVPLSASQIHIIPNTPVPPRSAYHPQWLGVPNLSITPLAPFPHTPLSHLRFSITPQCPVPSNLLHWSQHIHPLNLHISPQNPPSHQSPHPTRDPSSPYHTPTPPVSPLHPSTPCQPQHSTSPPGNPRHPRAMLCLLL